jgi:hypothetical protein
VRRKKFDSEEIDTIFRLKSLNCHKKQIGKVLKASPDAVKHAYRRVNKKADLPPKEKVSKSLVTGRLTGLAK